MNYCTRCGGKVMEHDRFCPNCGAKLELYTRPHRHALTIKEPKNLLLRELAYSGTLFWLLLCACAACWGMKLTQVIELAGRGSILEFWLHGAAGLVFTALLLFMLFLAASAFQSALAIHRREEPKNILFFHEYQLIRYEEDTL